MLPPADRYTNTAVDGWPAEYRDALRRELVAIRQRDPEIGVDRLVLAARGWLKHRERPVGVPKVISAKHVEVLIAPPPRRRSGASPASAPLPDRTTATTTISRAELLDVIKRNRVKDLRPSGEKPGPKDASKRARKAAARDKGRNTATGARKVPSRERAKPTNPPTRAAEGGPAGDDKRAATRASAGWDSPAGSALVSVHARRVPPAALEVTWELLPDAVRARVDILGPGNQCVRRARTTSDVGHLRIGRLNDLPLDARVRVLVTGPGGEILACGETALPR